VHIHLREGRKLLGTMGVVLSNREVDVAGSADVKHALEVSSLDWQALGERRPRDQNPTGHRQHLHL
jgi:hypothetical protein